jgi:hypothetical protein
MMKKNLLDIEVTHIADPSDNVKKYLKSFVFLMS